MSDHAELRARADQDGIEFFFAMFVEMHGKPCAKLVPASSFDMLMNDGVGFAGFASGPMGQSPSDPDMIAIPDPDSYLAVPWQPGLAILQCDIYVEDEPWPYAPRVILKNELARPRRAGPRPSTPAWKPSTSWSGAPRAAASRSPTRSTWLHCRVTTPRA